MAPRFAPTPPPDEFTGNERERAVAPNAIAAVLLVIAWYGVAGEARLSEAGPWANLSAVGLVVAAFGNVRLILVARHRIGLRQATFRRSRLAARRPHATDGR